jgi:hypothetical protein
MDELPAVMTWNPQLELILAQEGERALCYGWLHNNAQKRYVRMDTYITLPTIILSTISGSASIGSQTLFPSQMGGVSSIAIGSLTLSVGLLNTVSSFFGWGKRSEAHKAAATTYSKIHRFIMIELSLPRNERMTPKDMLKIIRDQLDRLLETSPQIPDPVIELFREKFYKTTPNVTKPEITNGLDPIHVYHSDSSPRFKLNSIHHPEPVKISIDGHNQDTLQTLSSVHPPSVSASGNNHTLSSSYNQNTTS